MKQLVIAWLCVLALAFGNNGCATGPKVPKSPAEECMTDAFATFQVTENMDLAKAEYAACMEKVK